MFSRSPQGGWVAPLDEKIAAEFKKNCRDAGQKEWYIHAPYFINFASTNNRIRYGSRSVIRQELERGSLLGAKYVMTHLGSYSGMGEDKGFEELIEGLFETLKGYTGETKLLLENSAGAGSVIGDTFDELAEIVHHAKLKKYELGICYDTQHAFASGYDVRTPEAAKATLKKFDETVGLDRFSLSHCNDSKIECGGHKDRHEHIGEGLIGLSGFKNLFANKQVAKANFIAETEHDKIVDDLEALKSLRSAKK
jgi:deoxyribonuclease-4